MTLGAITRTGRHGSVVFCALLVSVFAATQASAAGATTSPALSAEVLSSTLPGFVAATPGPTNGPLTPATAQEFGGSAGAVFGPHLTDGDLTGYVRVWTHTPPDGDAIEVTAIRFRDPAEIPSFLAGYANSASQSHSSPFAVPDVPGATGYATTIDTASGVPAKAYLVDFTNSNTAFLTVVLTESDDLTSANAIAIASEQASQVGGATVPPNSSSSSAAYVTGEILGAVLLMAIAVIGVIAIVRRSRRSDQPHQGHTATANAASAAFLLPTRHPLVPGWVPIANNHNTQVYWDGQSWIARRTWFAGRWGPETPISPAENAAKMAGASV
jgi:hypothetical protein